MLRKYLFTISLVFSFFCSIQADGLTDKLTTLKDKGLIPLKNKLNSLKDTLGELKNKLELRKDETTKVPLQEMVLRKLKSISFDKKSLEQYAQGWIDHGKEKDGYGYKTANLCELQKVVDALVGLGNKGIQVPNFVGISSYNIKKFLKNNYNYDLDQVWNTFVGKFNQGQRNKFRQDKIFSSEFLQGLKIIEDKIRQYFEAAALQATQNNEIFNFNNAFGQDNINETIESINQKKSSLMVRSTGREDTDVLANAGGNESVSNVAPVASDILRATGVVVSSYFRQKSFTQRLGGDDTKIFDAPFTPVLIQRMVGERILGLRSENVKAFLKSKGIGNVSTQQAIKQVVINAANNNAFKFNQTFKAHEAQIDEMLEQASKNGWQLRVVSANDQNKQDAVAANKAGLAQAIATVIAGQIQQAGNFDTAYCAVVIEPVKDGKLIERPLTACGVMFTEEPEGGIAKKDLLSLGWDFSKQARSTGITLIQASYGHNEGVVNSLVGVDSYFVTHVDSIYPVIRPKPFRKFPSLQQGIRLEDRDNPKIMINASALSISEVFTLKRLSIALEHYYRKPMDVEFVIDRFEQVVYVVQARPIVHNPKQIEPSYLKDISALKLQKYKGSVIGAAGGALRIIGQADHVIASKTIGEALQTYLKHKNKDAVQCIIIGEHAPATSHEATQFRTEVKPVIFVPMFDELENKITQQAQLVVDVQQETVIEWPKVITSLSDIENEGLVEKGWRSYPISREISLIEQQFIDEAGLHQQYLNFLEQEITKGLDETLLHKDQKREYLIPECLDFMRSDDSKIARTGLTTLMTLIVRDIHNELKSGTESLLKKDLLLLKYYVLSLGKNIAQYIQYKQGSDEYMQRLYYLRFFEALIYQQRLPQEILQAGSLAQLIFKVAQTEKNIIKELKKIGVVDIELVNTSDQEIEQLKKTGNFDQVKKIERAKTQVQLVKIRDYALTNELADRWLDLAKRLGQLGLSDKEYNTFISMIYTLITFDMLPIWMNTSFEAQYNQNGVSKKTINQLVAEYAKSKNIFDNLQQKMKKIGQIKPELFTDSKTYQAQKELLQTLVSEFAKQDFKNLFKNAEFLGKAAALSTLEFFVDLCDKSVKATKVQDNVARFQEMLLIYISLLKNVCSLEYSDLKNANNQMNGISYYTDDAPPVSLPKLDAVEQLLANAPDNDNSQMYNSPSFDVNIPVIGSAARFKVPKTLEDIFTFIHQSLINVNSWLMQKIGLDRLAQANSSVLPTLVKNVLHELYESTKDYFGTSNVSLMGINFKGNTLSLKFNYPLRSHSTIITLDYVNSKKPFLRFSCNSSGENEWGRFYKMGEFFKTIGDYLGLESEVKEANKSVTYTWNITQEKLNQVNNKYPNVMILVLAFIWANDGKAQDGLSYATEYLIQVLNVENIVFNSFIAETLCKNDANLKHQFAERIIDQSLIQNRVHMYIERVLDFIKKDNSGNAVWQKVFQVMEKLLSNSPYAINSDLLFFRFYRSPHLEGHNLNLTDLEEKYYTTSAGNLYERLKNEEDIKNDSNQAIFALSTLGIYKFNNGFAQRMFKKIVDLYGDLNKTTQTNFKNFINTHNHFFSSLRQIKIDLDDYGNITKRIYQDYEPYEKFRKFK